MSECKICGGELGFLKFNYCNECDAIISVAKNMSADSNERLKAIEKLESFIPNATEDQNINIKRVFAEIVEEKKKEEQREKQRKMEQERQNKINSIICSTTEAIPNHEILEIKGIVAVTKFFDFLCPNSQRTKFSNREEEEGFKNLKEKAFYLGANAIIGIKTSYSSLFRNFKDSLPKASDSYNINNEYCFHIIGTAVVVEKKEKP